MSSYVVSDETALAIAQGLVDAGRALRSKQSMRELVKGLLNLNRRMTAWRYEEDAELITDEDAWEIVDAYFDGDEPRRTYTPEEVIGCCRCWRYQCDVDGSVEPDPLFREVGYAAQDLIDQHVESGEWKLGRGAYRDTYYAKSVYQCGKKEVIEYDAPVEFPWGID